MSHNNSLAKDIFLNSWLHHALFWMLSFAVLLNLFAYGDDFSRTDFIYTQLFHLPLIVVVYINLWILIPYFLQKKKYIIYVFLFLLNIAFATWFAQVLFEKLVDYIFPGFFFISYYEFRDYALFTTIYLLVSTLLKMSKGWFELIEAQRQLNRLKEENLITELQALKSQINPHFLFNSLNSIYALSLDNEQITPKVILKLSELLRFMLYEANEEKVSLEKEIYHLNNYVELQKLRVRKQTDIQFEATSDLKDFKIAPLLLMPLVENGFKHGIKGDVENAFIHITSTLQNEEFIFSVKNNIGQVDEVEDDKYKGIGLNNVKRRLALLYPQKHDLKIENDGETFFVTLKIQLK